MYPLLQFLYLGTALLTYKINEKPVLKYAALITITLVLSTLTHPFAYILPILAITYIVGSRILAENQLSAQSFTDFLKDSAKPLGAILTGFTLIILVSGGFISALERVMSVDITHLNTYHTWISNNLSTLYLLAITGTIIPLTTNRKKQGTLLLLFTIPTLYIQTFHVKLTASRYLYFTMPFLTIWAATTLKTSSNYITENLEINKKHVLTILTLLLLTTTTFTLTPQTNYELGVNAPQPDFKNTYQHVENNSQPGDLLVSGWTAPALHYYRAPDYWLRFDISGTGSYPQTNQTTEHYTGAQVIYNQTKLEKIIQENSKGWIVLDTRAYNRQTPDTKELVDNQTLAYEAKEIQVWKWKNQ
jgi:hypothetical protein